MAGACLRLRARAVVNATGVWASAIDPGIRLRPSRGTHLVLDAASLGHPIAATGAVITAKCLSEMEREGHDYGLVTLCIGGGQGIAILLGRA